MAATKKPKAQAATAKTDNPPRADTGNQACPAAPAAHAAQTPAPIEVLMAYRQKGLSFRDIGKLVGVSASAVHQRLKQVDDLMPLADWFKDNRLSYLDLLQAQLLLSIDSESIKRMAIRDRIVCYGILHDKKRELDGDDILKIDLRILHGDLAEIQAQKLRIIEKLQSIGKGQLTDVMPSELTTDTHRPDAMLPDCNE